MMLALNDATKGPDEHEITAVNRAAGWALTACGDILLPSTWLDGNGDECEPKDAAACVVQRPDGKWAAVDLSEFEGVTTQ